MINKLSYIETVCNQSWWLRADYEKM